MNQDRGEPSAFTKGRNADWDGCKQMTSLRVPAGPLTLDPALFLTLPVATVRKVRATYDDVLDLEFLFRGPVDCIQSTAGRFEAETTSVYAGAVTVHEVTMNRGVELRADIHPNRLSIGFSTAFWRSPVIANGRRCPLGSLIVASGCELLLSVLGSTTMVWLDVDLDALKREGRLNPAFALRRINRIVSPHAAHAARLRNDANALLDHGTSAGRTSVGAAGQAVFDEFLARLPTEFGGRRTIEQKHLELVRRVEKAMWASVEEPATLAQICAATKCKMRTLIYAFESVHGLSPMKYFKILRLNSVRRKLAAQLHRRVFDVAADYGFWHMGHFSTDYKTMFGATPKDIISPTAKARSTRS
jgi:AraC family transcriptional regulator, ethanolamine operon transcriptional activator